MFVDKEKYFEVEDLKKYGVQAVYTTKAIGDIEVLFKDREKNSQNIYECFGKKDSIVVFGKQSHTDNIIDITDETTEFFYQDVDGYIRYCSYDTICRLSSNLFIR